MRRRAVLIRISTGEPIDAGWTPTIDEGELQEGNARMQGNHLDMRWVWADTLCALGGALTLSAAAQSHAAVQLLTAGSGS